MGDQWLASLPSNGFLLAVPMRPQDGSRYYSLLLTTLLVAGFALTTACLLLAYLDDMPPFWRPFGHLGLAAVLGVQFVSWATNIPLVTPQGRTFFPVTGFAALFCGVAAALSLANFLWRLLLP